MEVFFVMKPRRRQFTLVALLFCLLLSPAAWAKENPSYTQFGHTITIGPNDQVGDLTCFGCSIQVRGQVAGDVTTFGGSVTLEGQAQVSGDIATFGGDLRLDKAVQVEGDVAVFGGHLRRDPEASIGGDVSAMEGHGWLALIFLLPLVVLGLLVAGLVWLIQRIRRPAVPATAS